jgi:hypothetical protein|tara:strand:+ start:107 stop:475 length:369 start_codon:yes stop_codon:yes gene_type:complete
MNVLHNFLIPEAAHREKFWASQPTDDPMTINGFKGTFAFTDHLLIPQGITEFLLEHFHKQCFKAAGREKKNHISAIELDEINELMNEIWEGPGSMTKLALLTNEMRIARLWEPDEDEDEEDE